MTGLIGYQPSFIFIFQYKRQLYCRVISRCRCWSCAEESYAVLTSGNKIVQCGEIKKNLVRDQMRLMFDSSNLKLSGAS